LLSNAEAGWDQRSFLFADVEAVFNLLFFGLADGLNHHMFELEYLLTVFVRYFGAVFFRAYSSYRGREAGRMGEALTHRGGPHFSFPVLM
jgi:hypothetical protein